MFIKNVLLGFLISIFLIGCGTGLTNDKDVNSNKAQNSLGYYDDTSLFYNKVVTGIWLQRDTKYGFESMEYFENTSSLDMNDSYIDAFYNNQNYGVDITGDKLYTYKFYKYAETIESNETNESNTTITHYDYNNSIVQYYDFNSVNKENNCFNISKYEINNGNNSYQGDYEFCSNTSFTQHQFANYNLAGQWIQYEYDENDTVQTTNGLGIEFLYQFDLNGRISMNISLINTWIPLGKYATNTDQTTLTFEMGSGSSLQQFEFIENRASVSQEYQDENNVTQTRYLPCVKVGKYDLNENNNTKTFDKYYQLCKRY